MLFIYKVSAKGLMQNVYVNLKLFPYTIIITIIIIIISYIEI